LLTAPLFIVPLAVLIVLMTMGYTPMFAVTWALFPLVALSLIRKKTRPSPKEWVKGLTKGAITGAEIGIVCGLIGAIVSTTTMTGLGIKLPAAMAAWSGGILPVGLVITAVISIILGCGVTVAATYILVAIMAAPALIIMGLTVLQAHLFAFYFAVISFVTPPVALGSLFAARIADTKFFPTAVESVKVALAGFIVPFFMILCPVLILQPQPPLPAATGIISVLVILAALQIVICNYYITGISPLERAVSLAVAAVLIAHLATGSYVWFAAGVAVFAILTIVQLRKRRPSTLQGGRF